MGLPNDSKIHLTRKYERGPSNQITDVEGVSIGHVTLNYPDQDVHTGVTAILPHQSNLFQQKVMAGVSVIIILATEIPLSERQLKRVAKRATVGLARVGSYLGNGSGDIAIAFTTANKVPHYNESDILDMKMFADAAMDKVFEATAEAVEEAVISSLWHAEGMTGIRGKVVKGLQEILQ